MSNQKLTYLIEPYEGGRFVIRCLVCGMASFNMNDIEKKYCGNCHQFHSIMMAMNEMEEMAEEK